ncbi:carbamoyl phosphate synthase large subunit [Candidatus Marinamargulisbacteria bacterium SCGC AG-439-L15]|nr:carbamoyl phosphate synthase large subunit [Candidatus Marinamargulisbacteria bacterium SCGC AG-439-L15]
MPKRTDIKKIMIIGAGPIIIGQACEFDYSGTQACKALKEEGYEVILVNSNPATIMTDPSMADRTYVEPLTVDLVAKIIDKERPDALLPTVGGQTGLNLSMALYQEGVLDKYNVEMIGANHDAIQKAEAREDFKKAMESIGLKLAHSAVAYTLEEAKEKARDIGYPCVVRPAFTLGGTGGGIVEDEEELCEIAASGLRNSLISEVLIEESIVGWKEYELEVMRDKKDNVVIICSIENIDAMGVHTGDSITVAPAQTLTDKEYQEMRDASIAIMREIGVDTGGSNVQFALNPNDGRLIVIEMNPRVSRSSALASKATGFPIAKFAAKLAVGYTLDELQNDITKKTPACFEPTLDYVVVKIPRFDARKFTTKPLKLGTAMKSVGEAMSIGRTFKESFQKGLRSLETKRFGFGFDGKDLQGIDKETLITELQTPTPERMHFIKHALDSGMSIEEVYQHSHVDPWFLQQLKTIVDEAKTISLETREDFWTAKRNGFSDYQLAQLTGAQSELEIRETRKKHGVAPVYSLVDTCAGEFEAYTPYYYSTYETETELRTTNKDKVMILGGGPNRIGQGIEFDYCCVHASFAVREEGLESIMVNSNPETVSTDFDISDKLFFEPLTLEDVLNIYEIEKPRGIIVQFGGQTPLNLSVALEKAGATLLGTSSDSIDRAEDRERSQELLKILGLKQPPNGMALSAEEAIEIANRIEFPVVVRPSYVIGGTAMRIVYDDAELRDYMDKNVDPNSNEPILIDKFLTNAKEVDVDCLSDGTDAIIAGIMEHIEPAGVHSGDSACVYPPHSLSAELIEEISQSAKALARELKVIGLLNIQFAIKDNQVYVLEVNPRASRTVPFISKASGIPWAKLATKVIIGQSIDSLNIQEIELPYYAIKESVFPFNKFPTSDTLLSPEMKSTGEVMGIDKSFEMAYLKSQLAAGQLLPQEGAVFITVQDRDKQAIIPHARALQELGFSLLATEGTAEALKNEGITVNLVQKIADGSPNSLDMMADGKIQLVINCAETSAHHNAFLMRRECIQRIVPFISTIECLAESIKAIKHARKNHISVLALQDYYKQIKTKEVLHS